MCKLKSCPFCDGKAELINIPLGWFVQCQTEGCWCNIMSPTSQSKQKMIDTWNNRTNNYIVTFDAACQDFNSILNEVEAFYKGMLLLNEHSPVLMTREQNVYRKLLQPKEKIKAYILQDGEVVEGLGWYEEYSENYDMLKFGVVKEDCGTIMDCAWHLSWRKCAMEHNKEVGKEIRRLHHKLTKMQEKLISVHGEQELISC